MHKLDRSSIEFPSVTNIPQESDGLLAYGGDLSTDRLINAYKQGIFPWNDEDSPIMWWFPKVRAVFFVEDHKPKNKIINYIKKHNWTFKINHNFDLVIKNCAKKTNNRPETWITKEMMAAYIKLHQMQYAYSIETYENDELIGGLYGVLIGSIFSGESMYHTKTEASKAAFAALHEFCKQINVKIIDGQIPNSHLQNLGAQEVPCKEYQKLLTEYVNIDIDKEKIKNCKIIF